MPTPIRAAILDAVRSHGSAGCGMGEIVDALCTGGHRELEVELEIWEMLRSRVLVPHGFVARRLRHGGAAGSIRRSYEFLLIEAAP